MHPVIPATFGKPAILRVIVAVVLPMIAFGQPAKQKITREADVPRFQYTMGGAVEDLIKSESAFRPFAAQVRKNVESVLRDFDIEDAATRRGLLNTLASLDLREDRDDDARKKLDEIRALEEKRGARITVHTVIGCPVEADDMHTPLAVRRCFCMYRESSCLRLVFHKTETTGKRAESTARVRAKHVKCQSPSTV